MNLGAFDYVPKSPDLRQLLAALLPPIRRALAYQPGKQPVRLPSEAGQDDSEGPQLLTTSELMIGVAKLVARVAEQKEPVLIQGARGTGKSLVARAIHDNSPRRHKLFFPLYCPARNETMPEDELFGHEPGYGPGSDDKLRKGLFEHSHGGTLFLGAVADMPLALQELFLPVLEGGEVCRLGSNEPIRVDVRVLLSGWTLDLPTLKERGPDDLRLLANHFLERAAGQLDPPVPALDEAAWQALHDYSWPGNVSELKNCMFNIVLDHGGSVVLPSDLPIAPDAPPAAGPGAHDESGARAALRTAVRWARDTCPTRVYDVLHDLLRAELLDLRADVQLALLARFLQGGHEGDGRDALHQVR